MPTRDTAPSPSSSLLTTEISEASFEQALDELEHIVAEMEAGELPLEDSLQRYQRGMELLHHCQGRLAAAEQRIRVLEGGEMKDFKPGQD